MEPARPADKIVIAPDNRGKIVWGSEADLLRKIGTFSTSPRFEGSHFWTGTGVLPVHTCSAMRQWL